MERKGMDDPQRGAGAGKANEAGLQGGPTEERTLPIRTFCHRYGEQRLTLPERVTLIGMDIISQGRLTVDSTSGETVLTFELP